MLCLTEETAGASMQITAALISLTVQQRHGLQGGDIEMKT